MGITYWKPVRMKSLLVVAVVLAVASAATISLEDLEFHAWKLKFGKMYGSPAEEARHKETWLSNRRLVLVHNIMADQGIKSFRLGMTFFADMENQEYRRLISRGCLGSFNSSAPRRGSAYLPLTGVTDLPTAVDWRDRPSGKQGNWSPSVSSSWLTAPGTLATWAAVE